VLHSVAGKPMVQHLGQGAFHARSLARRQNHYC
jgi:bifunctional N-acetylglucosamine-1-phosphate-uridyltransferase/glucosamine-1-phosphate-acetyltransferase GlmU-like protein